MSENNSSSSVESANKQSILVNVDEVSPALIKDIGGVREMRLARDLEITDIRGVATADVETLTEIWSIGELTAMRVKGRAQGMVNKWDDFVDEQRDKVRPDNEADADGPARVAVVFGELANEDDELPDGVEPAMLRKAVRDGIEQAGIELDSNTTVGYHETGRDTTFGAMGGVIVNQFLDWLAYSGTPVNTKEFSTPWAKYAAVPGIDFGYEPDREPPKFSEIPFDTPRGYQDVEAWMAPAERTQKLVQWADHIVIPVDGEYADSIRYAARKEGVPTTTFLELNKMNQIRPYSGQVQASGAEIDDEESITGKAGTTVKRGDDGELKQVVVDEAEYEDSREWREGSPSELEQGLDGLEAGVVTRDEHRDDPDTGGHGVGSGSDRSGVWDDRFIA